MFLISSTEISLSASLISYSLFCPKRLGIGTDSVFVLQRYAFEELNLNRLETTWLVYNHASENLHLKCGWKIEGLQRKAIFKNGEYHDIKIASVLKNEYLNTAKELDYWN